MINRTVTLGNELFSFSSFTEWVNKAQSWFSGHRKYVCLDEIGRVCQTGYEFMRADKENCFPIRVYSVEFETAPQDIKEEISNSN